MLMKWKTITGLLGALLIAGVPAIWIGTMLVRSFRDGDEHFEVRFRKDPVEAEPEPLSPEMQLRYTLLDYLAQMDDSGREFTRQIIGEARLQRWQIDKETVYFSLPENPAQASYPHSAIGRFVTRIGDVRFASAEQEVFKLDHLILPRTPDAAYFFATPVQNLRVKSDGLFQFPYRSVTYTVSLQETMDFFLNKSVVGGLLNAATGRYSSGQEVVFANHGAFVAVRGEPSLTRLAQALVAGLPAGSEGRELRVQRLLDFVTGEIAYDESEATAATEVLRRPNEILMTRRGDCSNKSILFASLLDQIGEPYLFAYMPGHIAVAVPRGHFGAYNGLVITWEKQPWVLAETTAVKFHIGIDHLADETLFPRCEYLQNPQEPNVIVSRRTGEELSFR